MLEWCSTLRAKRISAVSVDTAHLVHKVLAGRKLLARRKQAFPAQLQVAATQELKVAQLDEATVLPEFQPLVDKSSTAQQEKKQWYIIQHLREDELSMLAGTPVYRSAAETPTDFLHGWALLGASCNHLGFDESNHSGTQSHTQHHPAPRAKKTWIASLGRCLL